jgi:hypothetical protein
MEYIPHGGIVDCYNGCGFVEIVQLRAIFGSLIFDLISDGFLSS